MKRSRWFASTLALLLLFGVVTAVSALTYRVTWGDTLSGIASRFGTSISTILQANPQITNPNLIYVGQDIEIPVAGAPSPTPPPPGTTPTPPPPTGTQTYTVQAGDTLSAIARRLIPPPLPLPRPAA
jgi:LysM repeat protein